MHDANADQPTYNPRGVSAATKMKVGHKKSPLMVPKLLKKPLIPHV